MNRNHKKIEIVPIIVCLFCFTLCSKNPYNIRSVASSGSSARKIFVGYIENRDLKTLRQTPKDFKDLLKFELIKNGFNLISPRKKQTYQQVNKDHKKEIIGSLPDSLRRIAGESDYDDRYDEKLLDKEEITQLAQAEKFDVFLQGSISIQSNDLILDKKEYNYIFLHVFDSEGNHLGILTSTFDNKILYESELLKKVAEGLAFELKKNAQLTLSEFKDTAVKANSAND